MPIETVIDTSKELFNAFYHYVLAIGSRYRTARFGWPGIFFYWLPLFDTDGIQAMHWNVSYLFSSEMFLRGRWFSIFDMTKQAAL
jgi:hypothetical protein